MRILMIFFLSFFIESCGDEPCELFFRNFKPRPVEVCYFSDDFSRMNFQLEKVICSDIEKTDLPLINQIQGWKNEKDDLLSLFILAYVN